MRKLFLTFLALIVQLCAWAFEDGYHKYAISPSTGELSGTSGTGDWKNKWVSTDKVDGTAETNGLILKTTANNFQASGGALDMRSGQAQTSTYTLTAPTGFKIASYTMTFKLVSTGNITLDTNDGGGNYLSTSENQTIRRVRPNQRETTFVISGANNGILVQDFEVEVVRDNSTYATLTTNVIDALNNANEAYKKLSTTVEDNIITSVDQLSSPYTSDGGDLTNLLKESGSWGTNSSTLVAADVHYLQVSLVGFTGGRDKLQATIKRTSGESYNHPVALRAVGYKTNDPNLSFGQGTDLGRLTFGYTADGTDTSNEIFDATGYNYIRFYWERSNGEGNQNGYWHCSMFQLNNHRGYHRELIQRATTATLETYMNSVAALEIGNEYMETNLNSLTTATSTFLNEEEERRSKYTWNLADEAGIVIKSTTFIKHTGENVSSPYSSNDFITVSNPSSFICEKTEDLTITSRYTVTDGFPVFAYSMDQLSTAKWYNIKIRNKYVIYDAASNTFYDTYANAPDADNKKGWFAFVGDPEVGFKIYNYGGACAFGSDNVNNKIQIKGVREEEAATYLFEKQNDDTWQVRDVRGADAFLNQQDNSLAIWNTNERPHDGNIFVISEVTEADVAKYLVTIDVTATDKDGNNPITWRADKFYTSEATVDAPSTTYPFFTNSYTLVENNDAISAENLHFNFTTTHTMPFVEGKFYQIKTRDKSSYLQYIPAGTTESGTSYAEGVYTKASTSNASADHLWYFKRKNNTPDYYTLHAVAVDKGIAGASMSTTPTEYQILKSTYAQAGEDGFVLAAEGNNTLGGHQKYNNYTTVEGSQISHWDIGKTKLDNYGNCFWVEEFDESIFNAYANGTFDATPNLVGAYTGSSENSTNVRNFLSSKTAANLRAALSSFQEQNTFNTLSTDKYYQFVAKESGGNTGRVMYATPCCTTTGGGLDFERNIKIGNDGTTASIPASAFKLQEVTGGYKIEHVNSKYWIAQLAGFSDLGNLDLPISNDNAGIYLIENVTGQTSTIWSLRDKDANTKYIHSGYAGNGNNILVRNQGPTTNEGCRWAIREITQVPVSVSTVRWATLCLPMPVTIPSDADLEVYYISEITSDGILTLEPIRGGTTVAKETPMLLYSSAETLPKTYNFAVSTETGTSYTLSNKLSGSTARRKGFSTTDSEYYGLANKEGVVGFYPSTSEIIAANKAYLLKTQIPTEAQNGARALLFSTDGDTETGITATEATTPDLQGAIYDMYGRQVKKMQRGGIYIINGTKVIVK